MMHIVAKHISELGSIKRYPDGIFDNTLFMNKDNSNLEDYKGKYKFNELEAHFFVDEILSYNDKMYEHKDSYVIEYFNIINIVSTRW